MPDVRCECGAKVAEYNEKEVLIMDRKCKSITVLEVRDGGLVINRCRSGKLPEGAIKIYMGRC